jgi:two-component system OmpR family response regulator
MELKATRILPLRANGMPLTIMLIEDDVTMRSLLEMYLQLEGFDVARPDPAELESALAEVRRIQPDLILLDVNLVQFSGYELLACLHSDPALMQIKVLMSSGLDVGERCLRAGANGFLLKPYMPEQLVGAIRSLSS